MTILVFVVQNRKLLLAKMRSRFLGVSLGQRPCLTLASYGVYNGERSVEFVDTLTIQCFETGISCAIRVRAGSLYSIQLN